MRANNGAERGLPSLLTNSAERPSGLPVHVLVYQRPPLTVLTFAPSQTSAHFGNVALDEYAEGHDRDARLGH